MAILRSVGAQPRQVFSLIIGEALLVTLLGTVLGCILFFGLLLVVKPLLVAHLGIYIETLSFSPRELSLLGAILGAGLVAGILPAWRSYRYSVSDGMTIRT
jgi:putative ABC transport system permease protein